MTVWYKWYFAYWFKKQDGAHGYGEALMDINQRAMNSVGLRKVVEMIKTKAEEPNQTVVLLFWQRMEKI